jgi:hypothetical protein
LISEDFTQTWINDPDWYRYSNKLEKVAKWQNKIEKKLGFDPVEYFGGMSITNEELN